MTEDSGAKKPGDQSPAEVEVREAKRVSFIWIVPLVAVIIAVGLGIRTVMERGPAVTITFETADGLEAGKTKVMYRSVEMGLVELVELSKDSTHVEVTVRFDRKAKSRLTEATKFWVVRPRIGAGGISGLGTLISGAYIEMDPAPGSPAKDFKGLEVPPLTRATSKGLKLVLAADGLGSISYGSPIHYRQIVIGEVTGYRLATTHRGVDIDIFINAPHHNLVRESSRFWNASGVEFSMGADGFRMRTESIGALLAGGISFDTPDADSSKLASEGMAFTLFDSYESSQEKAPEASLTYVLYFEGSVEGLNTGAPVEFRGIQVGEVTDVRLAYDPTTRAVTIPILIKIESRVLSEGDTSAAIATLVDHGMRAKLQTGNLLTGQRFVELELHPEVPLTLRGGDSEYPELPTMPTAVEAILEDVSVLVDKLGKVPIDKLVSDATELIDDLNKVVDEAGGELSPLASNVNKTLDTLRHTLESADEVIAPDSPVIYDLSQVLAELSMAARSIRVLSQYLERHPETLIFGKGGSGDK